MVHVLKYFWKAAWNFYLVILEDSQTTWQSVET